MPMTYKRIIDETASDEIYNDDWFLKDSVLNGTKKVQPSVIKEYMNQGMATTTALANEATARANADTALGGRIDNEVTARQNMDSQLASGISKQMSNLADFYDTTKSYVVGDVVMQQSGDLLRCIAPTSGAFDNTKWELVTIDELFDDLNFNADAISYDNETSGLEAENVQDAIDEIDGTVDQLESDVNNLETAMETKAEVDGIYDDLIAGNLLSDSYTSDSAPYLYRQSPSASSVEQNLIGASVAWNQLVQNGNFASTSGWSAVDGATMSVANNELTVTVQNIGSNVKQQSKQYIKDHKYIIALSAKSSATLADNKMSVMFYDGTSQFRYLNGLLSSYSAYAFIISASGTTYGGQLQLARPAATLDNPVDITIKNCIMVDLTQAFGTTIADYIYSLEQATAGSGIAWLKSYGFLTKDYYAYDSGSLQSVNVSGRKIVGKNLVDKDSITWNSGVRNDEGVPTASTNTSYSNAIKILPNTQYTISGSLAIQSYAFRIYFLTSEGNWISRTDTISRNQVPYTFTTPTNCGNIQIQIPNENKPLSDVQLEFGATATEYEPYKEATYPTSPIDLRGLFKLSNGNLVADGDVYSADGAVKRKYGVVDLGSLSWSRGNTGVTGRYRFITQSLRSTAVATPSNVVADLTTSIFITVKGDTGWASDIDNVIWCDNYKDISVVDSSYTDATAFKTAMSGVYLIYELATPTTETADAYENPQLVGSTEEFIDTRDVPIPVGGERKYFTDLKAKLEELAKIPDVPSTNGTYTLKATRSASGVEYSWVSD